MSLGSWLRQPTTITGIGSLLAAVAGGVTQLATGDTRMSGAVGVLAFSAVHLVINDNTVAKDVAALVTTGVSAAAGGPITSAELAPMIAKEIVKTLVDTAASVSAAPQKAGVG